MQPDLPDYGFHDPEPLWGSQYLYPAVRAIVASHSVPSRRAFDLGFGNGSTSNMLSQLGFDVTGIDPSPTGMAVAKRAFPHCVFELGTGYEDLAKRFGQFGLVISLEVLQHCAYPRRVAQRVFELVQPGGIFILSVTYHSYWKNLALAVTGQLDRHWNPLWDAGPLRFFSMRSLGTLLHDAGFVRMKFHRVGRIPLLAKSLIAVAHKDV